ncbi:hypothetical protein BKI52_09535 [marine bacterium AO1-C]|nr:hypothetical protein BKI52_09535 [marine bacterium AO1-C]
MKNSSPTSKNDNQLWNKYLTTIYQEQGTEPDSSITQKFWKNYENLIQQNQQQRISSLPQIQQAIPVDQLYQNIFLKYWNGVSHTITYDQQVAPQNSTNDSVTFSMTSTTGCFAMLGVCMLAAWMASVFDVGLGGFIFFLFCGFMVINFLFGIIKDITNTHYSSTHKKVTPTYTLHYSYQINADHLIFTKIDQHKVKKTVRLDYVKVKSLAVYDGELRLASMHLFSMRDLWKDYIIQKNFCIPVSMPQGQEIADFLQEILILNRA